MQLIKVDSYEKMSKMAATVIASCVIKKPACVLGFATGSTPIGTYRELCRLCQSGELDFSKVTTFNLDEYCGLAHDHEQSYHTYMQKHLFSGINILPQNVHLPDGMASDTQAACKEYEAMIQKAGGIDLQLLGIGRNGHIGFNEPAPVFYNDTHCVELAQNTIEANSRFFGGKTELVPKKAISMGIGTIMKARQILMLVSGKEKQEALQYMNTDCADPMHPASILQYHRAVTVIYTEE